MAIGAEALKVIGVSLKVTVAMRSPNVIDLCCDPNVTAEFTVLAKRPSAQSLQARDLAPVSRAVICAIGIEGRAVTHVDLPVLARVVPAGGAGRSPLPCAKMAALDHRRDLRLPSDRWPGDARRSWAGRTGHAGRSAVFGPVSSWTTTETDNGAGMVGWSRTRLAASVSRYRPRWASGTSDGRRSILRW